jgi:ribosomal protein L37AE/L43A
VNNMEHHNKLCQHCFSEWVDARRWANGYYTCMSCGEVLARQKKFTVAPMHKSNYMLISNTNDLKGLNNKGGLVK